MSILSIASAQETCRAQSAAHRVAVVELFTSEGCSSCPPADAWLKQQAERLPSDQVIFFAHHVPYWDYLGWKDRFADPQFQMRQRRLASVNRTGVYTPQFFVGGESAGFALKSRQFEDQLQRIQSETAPVQLTIEKQDKDKVRFSWQALNANEASQGRLVLALTSAHTTSKVASGENAGHELHHAAVTRWWQGPANIQSPSGSITTSLPNVDDDGEGQIILMMVSPNEQVLQAVALSRTCSM